MVTTKFTGKVRALILLLGGSHGKVMALPETLYSEGCKNLALSFPSIPP
jgi:hypothetical protein